MSQIFTPISEVFSCRSHLNNKYFNKKKEKKQYYYLIQLSGDSILNKYMFLKIFLHM